MAMLSSKGRGGRDGRGLHHPGRHPAVVPEVPVAGMALILGVDRL